MDPKSDSSLSKPQLEESLLRVQKWVENHDYKGYEPFDGLSSPFRALTFGNLFAERLLMQLIRQSPINLRPVLGVTPKESTKGRGYMAWGYLYRHKATGNPEYLQKAERCLDWLDGHKAPKYEKHSWSNHFDFSSRGGSYTKDDPIIVWTALIGQVYLEAFEQTRNERWLTIAKSVGGWIMDLPRERTTTGDCLSYLAHTQSSIHNANMLGSALLARLAKHTGTKEYLTVAKSAMQYSCSRQRPDGSWWYAEDPRYHWIDNFHTGYNLDSLKIYIESTHDTEFASNLDQGYRYFKESFFEETGRPKYYHNKTYPVDIQCSSQSIDTFCSFSSRDPGALAMAKKVAHWTIRNMQGASGHFYYREYPLLKARTPMLHWAQGNMYKALAHLSSLMSKA